MKIKILLLLTLFTVNFQLSTINRQLSIQAIGLSVLHTVGICEIPDELERLLARS